jgi:hypothetical protein
MGPATCRLPVSLIPKFRSIASMWNDVVNDFTSAFLETPMAALPRHMD